MLPMPHIRTAPRAAVGRVADAGDQRSIQAVRTALLQCRAVPRAQEQACCLRLSMNVQNNGPVIVLNVGSGMRCVMSGTRMSSTLTCS
jgi:hypothetical protein